MWILGSFYLRRMHPLAGLAILGAFLLEHIFVNATALLGAETFNTAVAVLAAIPRGIMFFIECFLLGIPFLFHGIYGVYIGWQAKHNVSAYGTLKNWQFKLQRWTAWVLLLFLLDHVIFFRFIFRGMGIPLTYAFMQQAVQNPIYFSIDLLGMLAAIFHFTNGITTFAMSWGITKGPRSQRVLNCISMLFGTGLFLLILGTLIHYKV